MKAVPTTKCRYLLLYITNKGAELDSEDKMLGEALRLIRVFNDLKQNEMADRISVSKSYLSEIEKGQKTPTLEVLQKYSNEFSLPVSSIMFFAEEIPKAKVGERVRVKIAKNIMGMLQFIERKSTDEEANHA